MADRASGTVAPFEPAGVCSLVGCLAEPRWLSKGFRPARTPDSQFDIGCRRRRRIAGGDLSV